jgi:uncharacterized membrane protein
VPAHLFVAHTPLVLVVLGAVVDLVGAATGQDAWRRWATPLLIIGAAAAVVAFATGQGAAAHAFARPSPQFARIDVHAQLGGAAVWVLVIMGGLRAIWRNRLHGLHGWINLAASALAAALVIAITYSGLAIAHGI